MNYKISVDAEYSCNQCGRTYVVTDGDLDFSAESRSERGMGLETQYCAEHECACDGCGNNMHLEFDAWVYPDGVLNHQSISASGAKISRENIRLEHLPEHDPVIEVAMLIKPLFQFRFDKFSEQLVDLWLGQYKKNRRLTLRVTYVVSVAAVIGVLATIYVDSQSKPVSEHGRKGVSDQIALLRETEMNLGSLEAFIGEKRAEVLATQEVLNRLEKRRAEIEPLVKANQEMVDAMFAYQQRELAAAAWKERWIGFGLGILASLVASIIWHFVGRFKVTPDAVKF